MASQAVKVKNDDSQGGIGAGASKIGISVGDVTGHGLEAAVAMSEIRRALRAAASSTDSPKALLNYVDGIVSSEGIGMATAIARTTPAQKPRGLRRRTLLVATAERESLAGEVNRGLITSTSIPRQPLSV